MGAIKEAVNNNAEAAKAVPVEVVIGIESSSNTYKWSAYQTADKQDLGYCCIIPRVDLDKPDRVQANFYNSEGTEIGCNYKQDDTRIIVFSRVNAAITAVFR